MDDVYNTKPWRTPRLRALRSHPRISQFVGCSKIQLATPLTVLKRGGESMQIYKVDQALLSLLGRVAVFLHHVV